MTNIIISVRSGDYHVMLEGHPEIWGCGKTVDEALGNWLRAHHSDFGFVLVYHIDGSQIRNRNEQPPK